MQQLRALWDSLYADHPNRDIAFDKVLESMAGVREPHTIGSRQPAVHEDWYKDAVVYSLYVPQFAGNMAGLISKLGYLRDLGVNCMWLLPILESPMHDEGFDICDYRRLRADLFPGDMDTEGRDALFDTLLEEAHKRDIRTVFDIALNHCSALHPWFVDAASDPSSPYRDYFMWADDDKGYANLEVIFSDTHNSNWTFSAEAGKYYFHRFYDKQPDLNYKNPMVLAEILDILLYWQRRGIDGFRLDAASHYWKEEGTDCIALPQTHLIIRIMRAVLDRVRKGTLLLAEATLDTDRAVRFFGNGSECHAAYNFPLTQRIFLSLARENSRAVRDTLSPGKAPRIPENASWFLFLRNHDELTLHLDGEAVSQELHVAYCLHRDWEFRDGTGLGARLADLLRDPERVILAHALMCVLPGSPVLYYGDEFFMRNDEVHAESYALKTGIADSRYRVRGPVPWKNLRTALTEREGDAGHVYGSVRRMLRVYAHQPVFRRGTFTLLPSPGIHNGDNEAILYIERQYGDTILRAAFNFSGIWQEFKPIDNLVLHRAEYDILEQPIGVHGDNLVLPPYGFYWAVIEGWSGFTHNRGADTMRQ